MTESVNDGERLQFDLPRGERPHFLRSNRRLRHLLGLSLRNLSITPASQFLQRSTTDDEALPYALSSPQKSHLLNETHRLAHSRSAASLQDQTSDVIKPSGDPSQQSTRALPVRRPNLPLSQRRNTLEWSNAGPKQRQERVEEALKKHTADVFFSIHMPGLKDPVYVSEVVRKSMNPEFRSFNLSNHGPCVTRSSECRFKIWAKHHTEEEWTFVLDIFVNLKRCQYVGKNLESCSMELPENTVFIHLSDGIYACISSLALKTSDSSIPQQQQQPTSVNLPARVSKPNLPSEPTSSYDALIRLSTLDTCIQDALATQAGLTLQTDQVLGKENRRFALPNEVTTIRDRIAKTGFAVETMQKEVRSMRRQTTILRQNLDKHRQAADIGRAVHARSQRVLNDNQTQLLESQTLHKRTLDDIFAQRRRICNDILIIFPIEPIKPPPSTKMSHTNGTVATRNLSTSPAKFNPLSFTIRGLPLPNSNFHDLNLQGSSSSPTAQAISASLGFASHVVTLLSAYLSTPLPYIPKFQGSTSTILDPVSLLPGTVRPTAPLYAIRESQLDPSVRARTFPLHIYPSALASTTSTAFSRFEYAVFLLNKDIERLASSVGVSILDIRQTLPNLKYVLFVVTAGKSEAPVGRKGGARSVLKGGVSEVIRPAINGSAHSSRRGSGDSAAGEGGLMAEVLRRKLEAQTRGREWHGPESGALSTSPA